ncbi:transmembrane protein 151B-like isoform X2 [Cimex lectularius]|nr:transmembrane protein 151B-like isoform X2 [Cimex lectularius]
MSPCDEGYIYIPLAFMAMLYLVYLVECWHCTARIELGYRVGVDTVLQKVQQMRDAQPIVWWKAVCYHYVRRKRQVTRYRNGDAYTSTQVYYERVNSHAAAASFMFAYCGVRDISKRLVLDHTNGSITKIRFSKGFAFANVEAAAEFEEQRARFFAEQERYDDYMEMREGLDLTNVAAFREHVIALANPDKIPWYAGQTVYWLCSFLLLSWPLRLMLEYNTAYLHYKVTKLFGVNYETGMSGISTPTSYCAVSRGESTVDSADIEWGIRDNTSLVPSYSEAVLMEGNRRASGVSRRPSAASTSRPLFYPSPLAETSPADPLRGIEPPSYEEAITFPALTRMRRSLTDRGEICSRFTPRPSSEAQVIRTHQRPRTLITMETSL